MKLTQQKFYPWLLVVCYSLLGIFCPAAVTQFSMVVGELAEALGVEFPEEEESDTLGGLVFAQLSVIPEDGAQLEVDACGLHIQVRSFAERRVDWALVSRLEGASEQSHTD